MRPSHGHGHLSHGHGSHRAGSRFGPMEEGRGGGDVTNPSTPRHGQGWGSSALFRDCRAKSIGSRLMIPFGHVLAHRSSR